MSEIAYIDYEFFITNPPNGVHIRYEDNNLIFENIEFSRNFSISLLNFQYAMARSRSIESFDIPIFSSHKGYRVCFKNCKFKEELEISKDMKLYLSFEDCEFNNILFDEVQNDEYEIYFKFKKPQNKSVINELKINKCKFRTLFNITGIGKEKCSINHLKINESVFEDEVQIYSITINDLKIKETEFYNLILNNLIFCRTMKFHSVYIKGFGIFEECLFNARAVFKYVYFYEFTQFRNSIFKKGLDLDRTNIKEEMNFYGVQGLDSNESKKRTSQETYRIIKHNFEEINNRIEANKYHALELEKRKTNLFREKGHWQEKLIFLGNWCTSKFATNWVLALFWIVFVGFLTALIMHSSVISKLYDNPSLLISWDYIERGLGIVAKYMSIIHSDEEIKEHPILFLFNKVALGYLYYQFVTAVRKDTRK